MPDNKQPKSPPAATPPAGADVQGEGNYDTAREFDDAQAEFVRDSGKVDRKAREAAEALDGPEGEQLRKAEKDTAQGNPKK